MVIIHTSIFRDFIFLKVEVRIKLPEKARIGVEVKNGMYTVYIEVVREHGTYQLMSHEIKVGQAPFKFDLGSNAEVSAASLEYKKKD